MARPKISPAVLADKGRPMVLLDGTKVHLCFSFQALMLVEEAFGSVTGAVRIVADSEGATYTNTVRLLSCGLSHEVEPGENGNMLSDPDVLAEYLDPAKFEDYVAVIGDAFQAAFPPAEVTPDPTDGETTTTASPGVSGTTSPSSTTDSPQPSSGA